MLSQEQLAVLYGIYTNYPSVTTDSRNIPEGSLFFALRGNSFDGNKFAADALSRGAVLAVIDNPAAIPGNEEGTASHEAALAAGYLLVDDVLTTLQALAAMHRSKLGIPILAITGTNGKTTTKELVAAVLSEKFNVSATSGNLNNHIGVPLTLLSMRPETEFGIVEMGASGQGEIAALCRIAKPNYGIITNIGKAHLAGFGGEEGIKIAKGELYDWLLESGGDAFVRNDDAVLTSMASQREGMHIIWYSSTASDGFASQLAGDYNMLNIAAAAAIGTYFDIPVELLYKAIRDYTPTLHRSQIIHTRKNTVVADCYNANPSSMQAALEWFGNFSEGTYRRSIILGDMLELGEWSTDEHKKVIEQALKIAPQRLILIGDEFNRIISDANLGRIRNKTSVIAFPDTDSYIAYLRKRRLFVTGRTILLKGSRGIALERLLKYM